MTEAEQTNKTLVIDAFDTLFNRRDYAAAQQFWSPHCIQHSALIAPGRDGHLDLIKTMPPDLRYEYQLVVAEGDYVIVHGRFSQIGQPTNWIVTDIVRVADGLLAEHWDVIQDEATRSQSRSGLPMFGDTFPTEVTTPDETPAPVSPTDTQRPESQLMNAFVTYLRARPDTDADAESTRTFNDRQAAPEGVTRRETDLAGVPAITIEPAVGRPDRTVIYFHGGGYVNGSPPEQYLPLAAAVALAANATVHAVDYRLAPEYPFPAAHDDCVSAYTWLVGDGGVDPRSLSVLGDSAGGNLALAVTVAARDRRLPAPAHVAIISPFADLTFSGPSIEQRRDRDPYVTRAILESMATDYLGGSNPADPRCSAVFADLNGLPPLLIQVGENEILYDDATRIRDHAQTTGVDVTFESWQHAMHVWPVYIATGLPESAQAIEHLVTFLKEDTPAALVPKSTEFSPDAV
ncbi:alpha/beta hydrolase fold domain-containing protein [Rhodococcus koreensis]|uniref:alpha/beta hydrolase fold domain-containing protein n=1 Tax=Rhodococcus koreensis TaxID=99653 RepID=UPI00366B5653